MKTAFLYFFLILAAGYAENNELYKTKADFYLNTENYAAALKYYSLIRPQTAKLCNKIGFTYYNLQNFNKAAVFFQKAISLNSNTAAYVYNNLGAAYLRLGQYKKAETALLHAVQKKKKYTKALYNLAAALFYQRQYSRSFSYALEAFKANKQYVQQRFNKKKILKKINVMRKQYPNDKELEKIEKKLQQLNRES